MFKDTQKTTVPVSHTKEIPSTPLRFMWHVSSLHKRWLIGGLFVVGIAELVGTSVPYIFKSVIDVAGKVSLGTTTISDVWFWALMYPVAVAIVFVTWRGSGFIGMEWASRSNATVYKTLFSYLSRHSHSYFSDRFAGSLSSKISHASEGIQSLFEAFIWNYYPSMLSLIITVIYMWFSSKNVALIFLGLVVILVPVNILLARYRRPHVVKFSAQATKARGFAVDAITNMSAIRQFARMTDEQKEFNKHINEMRALNIKQWRISEWGLLLNNAIIVIFEAIILFVTVRLWIAETITIGELVMIVSLMMNIQNTLVFIGMSMNGFIRRFGEVQEGLTDILIPYDIIDERNAKKLRVSHGQIECKDVAFEYESTSVFKDFNLIIQPGERIGLVGSSGAGKTTFVSLLLRQHELEAGAILIDGQNIREVTQDSLREHIAVVPQESLLFHRSIFDNIAYGKPHATKGEVISVAKKAQAHEFISELKEGYDTLVGERGVKLSGGQRQRVAIARAMLKDAPILVLDEATSALDSESEVAIQKALHALMEGKTVIAIAHRLSTLREMDRIIVLESGKIVEDGTHDVLANAGGTYARLWAHQAGGFLPQ